MNWCLFRKPSNVKDCSQDFFQAKRGLNNILVNHFIVADSLFANSSKLVPHSRIVAWAGNYDISICSTNKSVVYVRLKRNYVKNDIFLLPTHPQWRLQSENFFWLSSYVSDDTRARRSSKTAAAAASTNLNFRARDLPKPFVFYLVLLVQSSDTYIVLEWTKIPRNRMGKVFATFHN